jgi:hypothetical protein
MQDSRWSAMRATVEVFQLLTKPTTLLDISSVGIQGLVSKLQETQPFSGRMERRSLLNLLSSRQSTEMTSQFQ